MYIMLNSIGEWPNIGIAKLTSLNY